MDKDFFQMNKIYISIFIVLISIKGEAQVKDYCIYRDQKLVLNSAMSFLQEDSFTKAEEMFKLAMSQGKLNTYYSIQALYTFSITKNEKFLVKTLKQFPLKYVAYCKQLGTNCVIENEIINDTIIYNQINKSKSASREVRFLQLLSNRKLSKKDSTIVQILKNINTSDQEIRKKFENNSDLKFQSKYALELELKKIDSINFINFISIIKKFGWPKQSKFGDLADLPLWHCNIENEFLEEQGRFAAENLKLDWDVFEHFLKRSDRLFNSIYREKKIVTSNLIVNNHLIPPRSKAEFGFVFDCLEYYNIEPNRVHILFNCGDFVDTQMILSIEKLIVDSYPKFKDVRVSALDSNHYKIGQIVFLLN